MDDEDVIKYGKLRDKLYEAESLLASCTDLANSWARDWQVKEGTPEGLQQLIGRLWDRAAQYRFYAN